MPRNRLSLYGVILVLIVSGYFFRRSDEPTITRPQPLPSEQPAPKPRISRPPTVMQPAPPPVQQEASTPEPAAQAPASIALHASVALPPENPAVREDASWPELPILRVPENSASEEAAFLARHLNRNDDAELTFPFLGELSEEHTRPLALGRLRAGYGRIFRDNSVLFRGRNGTAWEEPSCFYVKASFRF